MDQTVRRFEEIIARPYSAKFLVCSESIYVSAHAIQLTEMEWFNLGVNFPGILQCTKCHDLAGFVAEYTPIVYFGDPSARVLLISTNPSGNEYRAHTNRHTNVQCAPLRCGNQQRGFSVKEQEDILRHQQEYFSGNYLDYWFDPAEEFLNDISTNTLGKLSFGLSGNSPTVAHIDIFKCATKTAAATLAESVKSLYSKNCSDYLISQLEQPQVRLLIINGEKDRRRFVKTIKQNPKFTYSVIKPSIPVSLSQNPSLCTVYIEKIKRSDGSDIVVVGTDRRISGDRQAYWSGFFKDDSDRSSVAKVISMELQKIGL